MLKVSAPTQDPSGMMLSFAREMGEHFVSTFLFFSFVGFH